MEDRHESVPGSAAQVILDGLAGKRPEFFFNRDAYAVQEAWS